MAEETKEKKLLQWHPAFFAGLQIEFAEEAKMLTFENEHQLSKKPLEIDVLIVKKNAQVQIKKNIGRIFRKYNIFEYKSPEDYLSIDDFYKVYGYACFYKSDSPNVDLVKSNEITISFVCEKRPEKLLKHLRQERQLDIMKVEEGIYYIEGAYFPIQLLLTSELSKESNFWLRNLTNRLKERGEVNELVTEYEKNRQNELYRAMMNIIIRANEKMFEEVKGEDMCEALRELFRDEIEEATEKVRAEVTKEVTREVTEEVTKVVTREVTKEVTREVTRATLLGLLRDGLLSVTDVAVRLKITEAEVEELLAN